MNDKYWLAIVPILCFTILIGILITQHVDIPRRDMPVSTNVQCDNAFIPDDAYDITPLENGCQYTKVR